MSRKRAFHQLSGTVLILALSFAGSAACSPPEERGVTTAPAQDLSVSPSHEASAALTTAARTGGFADYDPAAKPYAFISSAAIWRWNPGMPKVIYTCWENPDPRHATERELVRQVVLDTWQAQSQLRFQGWRPCASNNQGIRIRVQDTGPHVKVLGRFLDGVPNGMVLNFSFDNWSQDCKANETMRRDCIASIAAHEFGHALGYAHEQNRFDAPGECRQLRQGSDGDLLMTPYDPESVMNYCNERYNNDGQLSEYDRRALNIVYGAP